MHNVDKQVGLGTHHGIFTVEEEGSQGLGQLCLAHTCNTADNQGVNQGYPDRKSVLEKHKAVACLVTALCYGLLALSGRR